MEKGSQHLQPPRVIMGQHSRICLVMAPSRYSLHIDTGQVLSLTQAALSYSGHITPSIWLPVLGSHSNSVHLDSTVNFSVEC